MKKILLRLFIIVIFLFTYSPVLAHPLSPADICESEPGHCPTTHPCQRVTEDTPGFRAGDFRCIDRPSGASGVIGNIIPPQAIRNLGFGAEGISTFLSNLVALIYVIAIIVLIFMILWGAFDWMTSEGDKEKIARARDKIINAIIGILLFAAAFGIIKILGQFTGFTFFVGQ